MSQWQLNFNCQISVIHQAAKQHNAVARIAGGLLAFFCQGIDKKKWSLSGNASIVYEIIIACKSFNWNLSLDYSTWSTSQACFFSFLVFLKTFDMH